MIIKCPVHGGEITLKPSGVCPQCDANLAPWLRLKELPEAYYMEGMSHREKGQIEEAIVKITTALSLNPKDVKAHNELANLYILKGLHKEAAYYYTRVLGIDQNNEEAKKGLERIRTAETTATQALKKEKRKRIFTYAGFSAGSFAAGILVILLSYKGTTPTIQPERELYKKEEVVITQIVENKEIQAQSAQPPSELSGQQKEETAVREKGLEEVKPQETLVAQRESNPPSSDQPKLEEITPEQTRPEESVPRNETIPPEIQNKKKTIYIVQKGDTLCKIARKKYSDVEFWTKICEVNKGRIKGPNALYVGQELILPDISTLQ